MKILSVGGGTNFNFVGLSSSLEGTSRGSPGVIEPVSTLGISLKTSDDDHENNDCFRSTQQPLSAGANTVVRRVT